MKPKVRKIYRSIIALLTIPFILTGCSDREKCDIDGLHVHKYVGTSNRGTVTNYYNSEDKYIGYHYEDGSYKAFHYERTDEYIPITKEDESFYKTMYEQALFNGKDNWDYLFNIMKAKKDYLEYEYEYSNEDGTFYDWHRDKNHYWNTGKVRVNHYRFCGHRLTYKNGKWVNERSPFVDDIRDIIDEYPYFELDCYKVVHKDYKFKKKELANLKVSDVSEFKKPDLDNSELYSNSK